MITVAGVVFSITIVALSLASSQYTSRVLRNFMGDRINQTVLGVFLGIFAYCLVVLRTIRDGIDAEFVPSLAVMGGLALAFVGIGFLIFFIHHISVSIQASSIIASAAHETLNAINHLFPNDLGESEEYVDEKSLAIFENATGYAVVATQTGYIENVDGDKLLNLATELDSVFRMERGVGEFLIEGETLIRIASTPKDKNVISNAINSAYIVGRQRTVQQDAGFGIRQLVDIALKALSPGINDTTTAVMCMDYLGVILCRLASRAIPTPCRVKDGHLRLIALGPSFESLLDESFDQIRQCAKGNTAILKRQIAILGMINNHVSSPRRRLAIKRHAEAVSEVIVQNITSTRDRLHVENLLKDLWSELGEIIHPTQAGHGLDITNR